MVKILLLFFLLKGSWAVDYVLDVWGKLKLKVKWNISNFYMNRK